MKAEVADLVNERETLTWLLPRELYALNSVDFSALQPFSSFRVLSTLIFL
jgi:hypothetical protein